MQREAWSPHKITEITNRNQQANADKYKMHLLPNRWSSRLGHHEY